MTDQPARERDPIEAQLQILRDDMHRRFDQVYLLLLDIEELLKNTRGALQ